MMRTATFLTMLLVSVNAAAQNVKRECPACKSVKKLFVLKVESCECFRVELVLKVTDALRNDPAIERTEIKNGEITVQVNKAVLDLYPFRNLELPARCPTCGAAPSLSVLARDFVVQLFHYSECKQCFQLVMTALKKVGGVRAMKPIEKKIDLPGLSGGAVSTSPLVLLSFGAFTPFAKIKNAVSSVDRKQHRKHRSRGIVFSGQEEPSAETFDIDDGPRYALFACERCKTGDRLFDMVEGQ